MRLVEFSLAHRIPVACFSYHKINKISISWLNYNRKQEILLKKLLQNQQNLKACGIYSCTGIYFFKLANQSQLEFTFSFDRYFTQQKGSLSAAPLHMHYITLVSFSNLTQCNLPLYFLNWMSDYSFPFFRSNLSCIGHINLMV